MEFETPKPPKPYVHQEFPRFVFSVSGKRQVNSVKEFQELVDVSGPGVWFDSPDKLPTPPAKVAEDWKAKFEASEAANAELRQVNGDLVAKLFAKPEPKAKADKAESK